MGFRDRKIEESAKHSFLKILVRVKISIYPIPNSTVFSHLQTSWGGVESIVLSLKSGVLSLF